MKENNRSEEAALSYLPASVRDAVKKTMGLYKGNISEIRLRADSPVFITVNNRNISCNICATRDEIQRTVRSLCGNSMYSHSETLREGYICTEGGLRTGICGRAVTEQEKIISVTDISSVCIRIPHRIKGIADELLKLMLNDSGGMLLFSKPGVGKTTVLRELAASLSSAPLYCRVAVVDTRFEICGALYENHSIDVLSGYPRAKGIETALRTLSPEYIICDEIANADDVRAVLNSSGAGVPVIASAHAGSYEELSNNKCIEPLIDGNVFKHIIGLERYGQELRFLFREAPSDLLIC